MASYYVNNNPQSRGEHEVHVTTCYYFSQIHSKTYLGEFVFCQDAVQKAKQVHSNVDGCAYCCSACHTR